MNLAPPTMHLLMQLLHEEIGLPERKTISLDPVKPESTATKKPPRRAAFSLHQTNTYN